MSFLSILLCLLASCIHAQTITFSPQGADALKALTGKRIKGIQIVSVIACPSATPQSVSAGNVYVSAISQGYDPIMPAFARAVIADAVSHNWRNHAIEIFKVGSIAATGLGAGRVISMSAAALSGLVIGHQIADELSARLQSTLPDPSALIAALMDPSARLDLSQGCVVGNILAVYPKRTVRALPSAR